MRPVRAPNAPRALPERIKKMADIVKLIVEFGLLLVIAAVFIWDSVVVKKKNVELLGEINQSINNGIKDLNFRYEAIIHYGEKIYDALPKKD